MLRLQCEPPCPAEIVCNLKHLNNFLIGGGVFVCGSVHMPVAQEPTEARRGCYRWLRTVWPGLQDPTSSPLPVCPLSGWTISLAKHSLSVPSVCAVGVTVRLSVFPCEYGRLQHLNKRFLQVVCTGTSSDANKSVKSVLVSEPHCVLPPVPAILKIPPWILSWFLVRFLQFLYYVFFSHFK